MNEEYEDTPVPVPVPKPTKEILQARARRLRDIDDRTKIGLRLLDELWTEPEQTGLLTKLLPYALLITNILILGILIIKK